MNIQALILAGGEGKRFKPLQSDKNCLNFLGKSVIEHNLDDLISAGVKDFVLVTNPDNQKLLDTVKRPGRIKIKTVIQKKPQGMADAVLSAHKLINKPLVIINGSDLLDQHVFKQFLAQIRNRVVAVGALETEDYLPGGYFKFKGKKLIGVVEKPKRSEKPSNYFQLVLDYFKNPQEFISLLKKTKSNKDDVYEQALDKLIKQNKVEVLAQKTYLGQIKYPWMVLKVMNLLFENRLKTRISKKTSISKGAVIRGPVIIEPGVRIFEGVTIVGPAYLGEGVLVGNNTMIRHSHIGANCVIGSGSEVVRSYLNDHCWLHRNYIGDSVLDKNVSLGAGAVTANLRLDEGEIKTSNKGHKIATGLNKLGAIIGPDVRIGVNASLMPGVTIGQNCFVGPGVVLHTDLDQDRACFLSQNLHIIKQKAHLNQANRKKFRKLV